MARRRTLGRVRRFQLRARLACPVAPFHRAPLKFRTAGFPQYGFKTAGPHNPQGSALPRRGGFDAPLVRLWLLDRCFPLAQEGMSGRVLAHPAHAAIPRVLCSARVVMSLASSLLRPDPPVSRSPCALRSRACASGLTTSRPSLLWVTDHSAGAAIHAPEQTSPAYARCFGKIHWPSPMRESGSAARYPTTRFTWEPFRRCNVRSPLRPQNSLAPLTGRTFRP